MGTRNSMRVDKGRKGLRFFRDKMKARTAVVGRWEKSLLSSDPGSELRLLMERGETKTEKKRPRQ